MSKNRINWAKLFSP